MWQERDVHHRHGFVIKDFAEYSVWRVLIQDWVDLAKKKLQYIPKFILCILHIRETRNIGDRLC